MRRKRGIRGNFTKIGVLCLALLLGMGGMGIGLAMWSDTLTIGGTMTTGEWAVEEGCTPGFWQGGNGSLLWDDPFDIDWTAAGGVNHNPFIHTEFFNDFFDSHVNLNGLTMLDLVSAGGGPDPVRKAARDVVAAYLNASFGMAYPLTTVEINDKWNAAIVDGSDQAFQDLHIELAPLNELGCPL